MSQSALVGHHERLRDRDHRIVQEIAPSGYFLAVNFTRHGAEYLATTYPSEWVEEYDSTGLMWFDPVVIFSMAKTGSRRWSDIKLPDIRGVFSRGQQYGLQYGVVISKKFEKKNNAVFTATRADRDISDFEIEILESWLDSFLERYFQKLEIGQLQIQALRLISKGASVAEAAAISNCSVNAMKARLMEARRSLKANTTPHAVAIAFSKKLL